MYYLILGVILSLPLLFLLIRRFWKSYFYVTALSIPAFTALIVWDVSNEVNPDFDAVFMFNLLLSNFFLNIYSVVVLGILSLCYRLFIKIKSRRNDVGGNEL